MILLYFLIGILASVVGALPLGASNIAVINTTIKQNAKQAFKIAIAAGVAEVILSYYALHCNMVVRDFFDRNMWIQILIVVILMAVGSFLIFKKTKQNTSKKKKEEAPTPKMLKIGWDNIQNRMLALPVEPGVYSSLKSVKEGELYYLSSSFHSPKSHLNKFSFEDRKSKACYHCHGLRFWRTSL